jgi:formate-dependent nitrite reductase membrane component NrfD
MAIYPGFLLSENKSIPFWNTPVLPVLFLFSGLSTGLAFLSLAIPLLPAMGDEAVGMVLRALSWSDIPIIVIQLILLWSYLGMSSNKIPTFSESLILFKKPLFIVGTLILGLILPLLSHGMAMMGGKGMSPWMGFMTGILLIIGAISLRFSILRAGVYLPRHSL